MPGRCEVSITGAQKRLRRFQTTAGDGFSRRKKWLVMPWKDGKSPAGHEENPSMIPFSCVIFKFHEPGLRRAEKT